MCFLFCFSTTVFGETIYDLEDMYSIFMTADFWLALLQYGSLLRIVVLLWKFPDLRQAFRTYHCCCRRAKKTQTEVVEETYGDLSKDTDVVYWNVKKGVIC